MAHSQHDNAVPHHSETGLGELSDCKRLRIANKLTSHSCPNCGLSFECDAPRHASRGSGAHYSGRIKKLNRAHELALGILKEAGAVDYQHGLGLSQIWKIAWDRRQLSGFVPTKQGISGRLSELAGLGMVKTQSHVQLVDQESMQFRAEKQPRWFLAQ